MNARVLRSKSNLRKVLSAVVIISILTVLCGAVLTAFSDALFRRQSSGLPDPAADIQADGGTLAYDYHGDVVRIEFKGEPSAEPKVRLLSQIATYSNLEVLDFSGPSSLTRAKTPPSNKVSEVSDHEGPGAEIKQPNVSPETQRLLDQARIQLAAIRQFPAPPRHPNVPDFELDCLGGLRKLKSLNLSGTAVKGPGLKHLRSLQHLRSLCLKDLPIRDVHLVYLVHLNALEDLALSSDGVTDEGLVHLGELYTLKRLSLESGSITVVGLSQLTQIGGLQSLTVSSKQLHSLAPLVKFRKLTSIDLSSSPIDDRELGRLVEMKELRIVAIRDTQVTDAGLLLLGKLKRLKRLDLAGTQVSDAGLHELRNLVECEHLCLDNTLVTEAGVAGLRRKLPNTQITNKK